MAFLRDLESYARESFLLSSLAVLLQESNAEMLSQGVVMVSRAVL